MVQGSLNPNITILGEKLWPKAWNQKFTSVILGVGQKNDMFRIRVQQSCWLADLVSVRQRPPAQGKGLRIREKKEEKREEKERRRKMAKAKTPTQCKAKTPSARQNTLRVRKRLPVQRPPVQGWRLSVHGKDSQCKAKTPSARQKTLSVRQRPQCMAKTPSARQRRPVQGKRLSV